jgi:hypothetical protein
VGEPQVAVEKLTDAVRAMPFRTRAEAMLDVLVTVLDDGETLLRNLRTDPAPAPTALSLLARREILTPEDLTEPESLLMVAESLLQLCEATGADGVREVLRQQGREAEEALRAALASGHPDREGLADLQALAERVPGSARSTSALFSSAATERTADGAASGAAEDLALLALKGDAGGRVTT